MSRSQLRYTQKEKEFISKNYGDMSVQYIADKLDRSYSAILSKARKLKVTSSRYKDLSEKKFGRLEVIERTDRKGKYGNFIWKCLCDCGNEYEVRTASLTTGNTRSCGCLKKDSDSKSPGNMLDLRGKTFGRLTAIEPTEERSGSFVVWKCKCSCGNYHTVSTGSLTSGGTKSCGCLNREKKIERLPDDYKGENHWNWKGGITPETLKARNSAKYGRWRDSIFERDDYICQKCGDNGYLHAHHILSFSEYKDLRYDINNGITFCDSCHGKFHRKYEIYNRECLKEFLDE